MDKRIVFKTQTGEVGIITPTPEILKSYSIDEVAKKDVPAGLPYKIVDVSDLPTDRTFRDAWEVDEAELTDGVGDDSDEFPEVR